MGEQTNQFAEISRLLTEYRRINERYESELIVTYKLAFGQLSSGWRAIKQAAAAYERQVATGYNPFQALVEYHPSFAADETRLHTPFLAHLLDINGSHRQGRLFFDYFVARLVLLGVGSHRFDPSDSFFFSVEVEKTTEFGRIDILITYRSPVDEFAIAIENKIWAPDQFEQCLRYHKFLQQYHPKNSLLIYLSPYGRHPETWSMDNQLFDKLAGEGKTLIASHLDVTLPFIKNALLEVQAPAILRSVADYAAILEEEI